MKVHKDTKDQESQELLELQTGIIQCSQELDNNMVLHHNMELHHIMEFHQWDSQKNQDQKRD